MKSAYNSLIAKILIQLTAVFAIAPTQVLAFDCYNKATVITDLTVTEEQKCASGRVDAINDMVTFATKGCAEYKSIESEIKRIQTNAKTLYDAAKSKESSLKKKQDSAASEFGTDGKAEYRIERYENWINNYKSLLSKYTDVKDKMKKAGDVKSSSGSAGQSGIENNVSHTDEFPCTSSEAGTSKSNINVRATPTKTVLNSPNPKASVTSDDLGDDCSEFSPVKKKFCDKKYECILWKEIR